MALIKALPDGTILQVFSSYQAQQVYPQDPSATASLELDETSNATLLSDLSANTSNYSLTIVAGSAQLRKNGVPVTVAAPSALYSVQSAILAGIPDATLKAAIVALWNGTAPAAQQQKALAYCLLKLHQAGLI